MQFTMTCKQYSKCSENVQDVSLILFSTNSSFLEFKKTKVLISVFPHACQHLMNTKTPSKASRNLLHQVSLITTVGMTKVMAKALQQATIWKRLLNIWMSQYCSQTFITTVRQITQGKLSEDMLLPFLVLSTCLSTSCSGSFLQMIKPFTQTCQLQSLTKTERKWGFTSDDSSRFSLSQRSLLRLIFQTGTPLQLLKQLSKTECKGGSFRNILQRRKKQISNIVVKAECMICELFDICLSKTFKQIAF